jgi:hypothetical protein
MKPIINGESYISLRIIDWFVTNYSKKHYTVYELNVQNTPDPVRFKVYNDYKLKLKAYSKTRFDSFCRGKPIYIPYNETEYMETTIGQLNFFKWAIENQIIDYIKENYDDIEMDMNSRNSTSKRKHSSKNSSESSMDSSIVSELSTDSDSKVTISANSGKTRKKREELSVSACKCIKKETVKVIVRFNT